MSGGHFNSCGYVYYPVNQFADELESEIDNNSKKNEYSYAPDFSEVTIQCLKRQLPLLRQAAEVMRHIDYLYSGDHGEDSFLRHLRDVEEKYGAKPE